MAGKLPWALMDRESKRRTIAEKKEDRGLLPKVQSRLERQGFFELAKNFTSSYIPGQRKAGMADPRRSGIDPDQGSIARGAGRYMGAGIQFAASILLFVFLGQWLDERLGTGPWLLLLGVFVGAAAGFHSLYRQLMKGSTSGRAPGTGKKG